MLKALKTKFFVIWKTEIYSLSGFIQGSFVVFEIVTGGYRHGALLVVDRWPNLRIFDLCLPTYIRSEI